MTAPDPQVAAATDPLQVAAATDPLQVAAATDPLQVAAATDPLQVAAATDPLQVAAATKGFLPDDEAAALRGAACSAGIGLWLEIGTYCGKSTVHLASVARDVGAHIVTVDHHRGSEENQAGWEWHDASLVDPHTQRLDTLPSLRRALWDAGVEDVVSVLVSATQQVGRWWSTPLQFLFLDGNHTEAVAQHDYLAFAPHVVAGGLMAVHDVFPDPRDGGRPPWHVVQRALGLRGADDDAEPPRAAFEQIAEQGSLRVLRRLDVPVT